VPACGAGGRRFNRTGTWYDALLKDGDDLGQVSPLYNIRIFPVYLCKDFAVLKILVDVECTKERFQKISLVLHLNKRKVEKGEVLYTRKKPKQIVSKKEAPGESNITHTMSF
jgi:hypothetical protein